MFVWQVRWYYLDYDTFFSIFSIFSVFFYLCFFCGITVVVVGSALLSCFCQHVHTVEMSLVAVTDLLSETPCVIC